MENWLGGFFDTEEVPLAYIVVCFVDIILTGPTFLSLTLAYFTYDSSGKMEVLFRKKGRYVNNIPDKAVVVMYADF
jgi:hypothetical protein